MLAAVGFFTIVIGCSGADPSTLDPGEEEGSGGTSGATGGSAASGGTTAGTGATGGAGAAGGTSATGGTAATGSDCVPMEPPAGGGGAPGCAPYPAPVAGGVLEGDLYIATAADAEAARGYSEITGNLLVDPRYCGVLELPNLVRVGGDVNASGSSSSTEVTWPNLTVLRLANLESIGGEIMVYLTMALVETDFRSLESVGVRVYYERDLALRRIGLDSLTDVSQVLIEAVPVAARCEIEAICSQVPAAPAASCAITGGMNTCTCETTCGRLTPVCPTGM